jgi:hypothetical protein
MTNAQHATNTTAEPAGFPRRDATQAFPATAENGSAHGQCRELLA